MPTLIKGKQEYLSELQASGVKKGIAVLVKGATSPRYDPQHVCASK